jgi:hypothetical protein
MSATVGWHRATVPPLTLGRETRHFANRVPDVQRKIRVTRSVVDVRLVAEPGQLDQFSGPYAEYPLGGFAADNRDPLRRSSGRTAARAKGSRVRRKGFGPAAIEDIERSRGEFRGTGVEIGDAVFPIRQAGKRCFGFLDRGPRKRVGTMVLRVVAR